MLLKSGWQSNSASAEFDGQKSKSDKSDLDDKPGHDGLRDLQLLPLRLLRLLRLRLPERPIDDVAFVILEAHLALERADPPAHGNPGLMHGFV